jgi:hypothetical protein
MGLFGSAPPVNALANGLLLPAPTNEVHSAPKPRYLETWARADFGQELQKPFWTITDSVPILLGINPVFASPETLSRHEFDDDVAFEGMRLRRLIADAEVMGDLPERARPYQVINWALGQFIGMPPALLQLASTRGLAIKGHPSRLEVVQAEHEVFAANAKRELAARNEEIGALRRELAARLVENEALANRIRDGEIQRDARAEPPPQTNLAGMTRKFNKLSELFFGLANAHHGIEFGSMRKPSFRSLMTTFEQVGMRPDDETLEKYLRHGSEQAARAPKSPRK